MIEAFLTSDFWPGLCFILLILGAIALFWRFPDHTKRKRCVLVAFLLTSWGSALLAQTKECQGIERWDVKVARDSGATAINPNDIHDTTIEELNSIEPVCTDNPKDAARQLQETKVYRIHAKLDLRREEWRKEKGEFKGDHDFHNGLKSRKSKSKMVAEAPLPDCAAGSLFIGEITKAREQDATIPIGSDVVVVGVLFFDFYHKQDDHGTPHKCKGKKIQLVPELHPILYIAKE